MKIKIKTTKATFYDTVTRQVFVKDFDGHYNMKQALEKLAPANKTKVVDVSYSNTIYDVDDDSVIRFLASNGEVINNE